MSVATLQVGHFFKGWSECLRIDYFIEFLNFYTLGLAMRHYKMQR